MLGIDPEVACYELNILLGVRLIRQKMRLYNEEKKAIIEEIKRLKEIGFINEVKYPIWLINIVVVLKKKRKNEDMN